MKEDMVNQPKHYTGHPSGVECIEIAERMGFLLGNAFKYVFRAGEKGDRLEDVKKAKWYVKRQLDTGLPYCFGPRDSRIRTEMVKTLDKVLKHELDPFKVMFMGALRRCLAYNFEGPVAECVLILDCEIQKLEVGE